ncbi:hypothetical protein Bca101_007766 [Brassica carinata]
MRSSVALKKDCRSDPLKKLLDRSNPRTSLRTKVFVEKYQSCDTEHVWCVGLPKLYTRDTCPQAWYFLIIVPVTYNRERGPLRIDYLNDIRRTPSVLRKLYLMRAIFFAKYTNYEREEGERTSQTLRSALDTEKDTMQRSHQRSKFLQH